MAEETKPKKAAPKKEAKPEAAEKSAKAPAAEAKPAKKEKTAPAAEAPEAKAVAVAEPAAAPAAPTAAELLADDPNAKKIIKVKGATHEEHRITAGVSGSSRVKRN